MFGGYITLKRLYTKGGWINENIFDITESIREYITKIPFLKISWFCNLLHFHHFR